MKTTTRAWWAVGALVCASAASAQSTVQLYGRINTAVEFQKYGSEQVWGMSSNGSFLGFKGHEDLGAGQRVGFVLEGNVFSDDGQAGRDGQGLDFKRRSELHLAGDWGMVRMGSFDHASYTVVAEPLNLLNDDGGSISEQFFRAGYRGNALAYRTPVLGGWAAEVQRNFGEKQTSYGWRNEGGWDLALNYAQGPWGLGLGYNYSKGSSVGYDGSDTEENVSARLSYTAGNWLLGGYYQWTEFVSDYRGFDREVSTRGLARVSAMYRWDASELHASVGHVYTLKTAYPQGGSSAGTTHWSVGYHYNVSKRSKVYALWGQMNRMPITAFPSMWSHTGHSHHHHTVLLGMRHTF